MYTGQKIFIQNDVRTGACQKRVAVIGCGVAGLVSIKTLLEDGHNVIAYERQSDIGGLWNYKVRTSYSYEMHTLITRTYVFVFTLLYDHWPNYLRIITFL